MSQKLPISRKNNGTGEKGFFSKNWVDFVTRLMDNWVDFVTRELTKRFVKEVNHV